MFSRIRIDPADQTFSLYIRKKAGFRCERCGRSFPDGKGLQCSHFIGRAENSTRFDPDNGDSFCTGCHGYMETHKPTAYREFKIRKLGQVRFDKLIEKSRGVTQLTKEDRKEIAKYFAGLTAKLDV